MNTFNFLWPLSGGFLIGLSAGLYLLLNGRIAGVSGLTAAVFGWTGTGVSPPAIGFLAGILSGAAVVVASIGDADYSITSSPALLIVGGLLVGFGTRLGSGCTSGHGVCGLARLSPRSIVATATFMLVAGITVFAFRQIQGAV